MPSVFTIQGPDLSSVRHERIRERVAKKRIRDGRTRKRVMDGLCDLRLELVNKVGRTRSETKHTVYQEAADAIQHLVERYPGGHEYFWSGRCGTKRRR